MCRRFGCAGLHAASRFLGAQRRRLSGTRACYLCALCLSPGPCRSADDVRCFAQTRPILSSSGCGTRRTRRATPTCASPTTPTGATARTSGGSGGSLRKTRNSWQTSPPGGVRTAAEGGRCWPRLRTARCRSMRRWTSRPTLTSMCGAQPQRGPPTWLLGLPYLEGALNPCGLTLACADCGVSQADERAAPHDAARPDRRPLLPGQLARRHPRLRNACRDALSQR